MSQGPTLKMKRRLNFVVVTSIVLVFCIVAVSVFNISVLQHDDYIEKATKQQLRPETIPANRGTIYDRNMQVIARSATVYDVVLSPANMDKEQKAQIAKDLSALLNPIDSKVTESFILEKSQKKNQYEIITRKVEKEVADKVRKLISDGTPDPKNNKKNMVWKGVDLVENTKRYYPNSTLAASVIGFTGTDSQGLYGIEKFYDEKLKGTPGYIVTAKNGIGENMPVSYEEKFPPKDGNGLVLTIDETIQHFLEKTLEQVDAQHKPKHGCAGIVMNVNNGEILAMANLPTFDLNQPFTIYNQNTLEEIGKLPEAERQQATKLAREKQWQNKAVTDTYEPGSTFKTIVTASALEEKTTSLNSTFSCPGFVKVGDRTMKCHKAGGHGHLDFTQALVGSCNPAFVKIGADLGAKNFFKYFKGFGLTEKTGIDLPGEGKSQYYTAEQFTEVSLASCSFGQSMTLTPMQLVTAVSAAVNGGNLITPHIAKDFLDGNGNVVSSVGPNIKRQVVSKETSEQLRVMMQHVVDDGGTNAKIKGYKIGGKSGTSQKLNQPDKNARISSYVAVAPADKPEIAVYIMIDEPSSGHVFGSVVAAPAVASILKDTLPYLGYNPVYSAEELAKLEVPTPYLLKQGVLEAQSKLASVGLPKAKVIGNGNTVVKQVPSVGSKMPKDGTVYIYTESQNETLAKVPNVVGLSPAQAKTRLESYDFNVSIKGEATEHANSKIIGQSTAEGTMLPIGTVIEITCVKADTD